MRITFTIGSLESGGAERVLALLSGALLKKGHAVSVVTLWDKESDFYELPSRVERVALGVSTSFQAFFKFYHLRRSILSTRPDVVISFMCRMNIMTLLVMRGSGIPIIVSERIDPTLHSIGRIWEGLRRWSYPFAARLIVQTEGACSYFPPTMQSKTCIIPNPVLIPEVGHRTWEVLSRPLLIAMGRLCYQKGFDLLLKAFAHLKISAPEWKLMIVGEGPLRGTILSLRDALGLTECVTLPGRVKNPYDFLKQADLFVLSSRFEGFPNVLCEAMACGLPVIATDCPSGPGEIIRNEIDGILVPPNDIDALSTSMKRLMMDETVRHRLASRAPEVTRRFGMGRVTRLWETLLDQVVLREKALE